VGKVSKVTRNSAGLSQELEVSPDVDFARLSEVLVVVAPAPPADPDASTHKPLSPSHGLGVYR
jgi:cell shape-determining protein MreC